VRRIRDIQGAERAMSIVPWLIRRPPRRSARAVAGGIGHGLATYEDELTLEIRDLR
jgi:hypothetical protein